METFPDHPVSAGSDWIERAGVIEKRLGDGYVQTAGDAPDNLDREYRAVFQARGKADIDDIDIFLRAHGGHREFAFTVPGEAASRTWRCEDWDREQVSAAVDVHNLTARFLEVT